MQVVSENYLPAKKRYCKMDLPPAPALYKSFVMVTSSAMWKKRARELLLIFFERDRQLGACRRSSSACWKWWTFSGNYYYYSVDTTILFFFFTLINITSICNDVYKSTAVIITQPFPDEQQGRFKLHRTVSAIAEPPHPDRGAGRSELGLQQRVPGGGVRTRVRGAAGVYRGWSSVWPRICRGPRERGRERVSYADVCADDGGARRHRVLVPRFGRFGGVYIRGGGLG